MQRWQSPIRTVQGSFEETVSKDVVGEQNLKEEFTTHE